MFKRLLEHENVIPGIVVLTCSFLISLAVNHTLDHDAQQKSSDVRTADALEELVEIERAQLVEMKRANKGK